MCYLILHRLPVLISTFLFPFEVRCGRVTCFGQQMWPYMVFLSRSNCQYETKQCSFFLPQWYENLWPGRASVSLGPWTTAMDTFSPFNSCWTHNITKKRAFVVSIHWDLGDVYCYTAEPSPSPLLQYLLNVYFLSICYRLGTIRLGYNSEQDRQTSSFMELTFYEGNRQ